MGGKKVAPIISALYDEYSTIAKEADSSLWIDFIIGINSRYQIIQLARVRDQTTVEEFVEALGEFLKRQPKPGQFEKFVNCANCDLEIYASEIGGRIKGRPYCHTCLRKSKWAGNSWYGPIYKDDPGPWQETAVRELEDGRF